MRPGPKNGDAGRRPGCVRARSCCGFAGSGGLRAALAVVVGVVLACGDGASGGPSGSAGGGAGGAAPATRDTALERMAGELVPAVERRAGLEFRSPPRLARASRASLEAFLAEQLEEELPPGRARAVGAAYARFGLLPDTLDLRSLLRDLYLEQVVGYYDPEADTLFVRRGVSEEQLRGVLVHEMVHALQDQHTDLDSLTGARAALNDAATAARAAIEGHATFVMMEWMMAERTGSEVDLTVLPGLRELLGGVDLTDLAAMPALGDAPRVIRESLVFPYVGGLAFMQELWRVREDRSVPLGADVPGSTEQILHPDRYVGTERDAPTTVRFSGTPPEGWREVHADGLGELETRIFLEAFLGDTARARSAAAGWDGDRYRLASTGDRELMAWATVWDSPAEALEFARAAREAYRARYGAGSGAAGAAGGEGPAVGTGERRVEVRRAEVSGRPVVLVVDGPAGRGASSWAPDATEVSLEGGT